MAEEIKNDQETVSEAPKGVDEAQDAPKKGAAKAEPMTKAGDYDDLGPALVKPDDKPGQTKASAKSKKDSSAPTKGAGAGEKSEKVTKEQAEPEDDKENDKEKEADKEDEDEIMEVPKTKSGIIQSIYDGLGKHKKSDLQASYKKIMDAINGNGDDEEDDEEEAEESKKVKKEAVDNRVKSIDVSADVDALVSGDETLSEEFKQKAATIFEAAVKSKVKSEIERLEGEYETELTEAKKEAKDELTSKVDNYLNYVVEQWMADNELAIEKGVKGEIAEDFIGGLKQLFEDHYIDIPDEKYDILDAKEKEIEELKGKVNEMTNKSIDDKKVIDGYTKDEIFEETVDGLADTEKEKIKSLVADISFDGADEYKKKLETIKESYFGAQKEAPKGTENVDTIKEESNDGNTVLDMSDSMSKYTAAISRGKSRDIYNT
jgi:hypothetical protein